MTTSQPNILMIMADQLTAPVLPGYGGAVVKAPHIERLAREGVLFEHAYCNSPLCAPSRASMMAGRLPSKIGAYDNAAEFAPSVATVAHGLRAQGYWTCLCGKMHFIGPDQLHGFEDRLTPDIYPADFGWTPDWDQPEERIDWWYHNMLSVKQAGIAEATNQLDFDDEVGFHALRFLKDYARAGNRRPFFLVVSFTHPHDPYATREAYWNRYEDAGIPLPKVARIAHDAMDPHSRRLWRVSAMDEADITEADVRRARRAYFGSISFLDDRIGEIMATLRDFGLGHDTIVVFTSDHGDLLGERGLWYKMCFFEWAVRVPLICHAPRRFGPRRAQTLVSLVDLMPTLLELGRPASDVPAPLEEGLDGSSLVRLLDGGVAGERTVCGEYLAEGALAPIFMIRRSSQKFIWSEPDPAQLFDLASDPDELDNLAARPQHAEEVRALEAEVRQRWDPGALHGAVRRSQRARRMAFQALSSGQRTAWDFRPSLHRRHYVAGAADLNDLERARRFPPPD
jgi:choline-sulfatase